MAINLASKYSDKILKKFTASSFIRGNVSNDYKFDGVKSVTIYTPQTVALTDYQRAGANRFGTPQEMQDEIQTLTVTQDKSFSITIDRGNNEDQMLIKEAGKMMKMQIDEQVVPFMDKYALKTFAERGGQSKVISTAPTKTTITGHIFDASTDLDNKLVPAENRIMYVPSSIYNLIRLSSEFIGVDKLAEQVLVKGQIGQIADMKVIKVPDTYFPHTNNVLDTYFIITYKNSVLNPLKIRTSRILKEVQGIDGAVLEGRFYYDAFVLGTKADGVFTALANGKKAVTPTITTASGSTTITSTTSGAVIKYTLDGTDPRYSPTAVTYSSALSSLATGTVVKAVATKSGSYNSDVATATI